MTTFLQKCAEKVGDFVYSSQALPIDSGGGFHEGLSWSRLVHGLSLFFRLPSGRKCFKSQRTWISPSFCCRCCHFFLLFCLFLSLLLVLLLFCCCCCCFLCVNIVAEMVQALRNWHMGYLRLFFFFFFFDFLTEIISSLGELTGRLSPFLLLLLLFFFLL